MCLAAIVDAPGVARIGSTAADAGRAGVFVLVLVAIVLGPAQLRWLTGSRSSLDGWSMYHDLGVGMLDARFVQRSAAGDEVELDPRVVLRSEPRQISRKLRGPAELEALGKKLCAALGPGVDVRAHARVATQAGWRVMATGQDNLCVKAPGAR